MHVGLELTLEKADPFLIYIDRVNPWVGSYHEESQLRTRFFLGFYFLSEFRSRIQTK
jgi:hypothetical protein